VVAKLAAEDGSDLTTQYQTFTATGKAQKIIDAEGYSTDRVFDAANAGHGLITKSTDAKSNIIDYEYDDYARVTRTIQRTSSGDVITQRSYYPDNTPVQAGRLHTETSPLDLVTTYTYDAHGNTLTRTESNSPC